MCIIIALFCFCLLCQFQSCQSSRNLTVLKIFRQFFAANMVWGLCVFVWERPSYNNGVSSLLIDSRIDFFPSKLSCCLEGRLSQFFHTTSISVIHSPLTSLSTRAKALEFSSPITNLGHRHTKLWWAGSKELTFQDSRHVLPLPALLDRVGR